MEESLVSTNDNGKSKWFQIFARLTQRQWILSILFAAINLLGALPVALQAPFYPAEAERKGATATEYGLVFGIFSFTVFVTSPIFGKYMNKIGPKRVFNICLTMSSIAVICFGVLDLINDRTTFVSLSLFCRFVEGLGCGGFLPATFTIVASEFPDATTTVFGVLETFNGLGEILGPTIGAFLFTLGGFQLPFYVMGSILLVAGLLCSAIMPKMEKITNLDGTEQDGIDFWTILKIPTVAIASISLTSATISIGYISATLEPHIRPFGLSPIQTGLMFIIIMGTYSISTPLWGYLCDKVRKPIYVTLAGNMLMFVGFLFIGPASFMPFDTTLWVVIIGLILEGLGMASCFISVFSVALKESLNYGLPDNMSTNGAVSGLWQSSMSLGFWVGPTVAGILYDNFGFRGGSYFPLGMSLLMLIVIILHECCIHKHLGPPLDERQPLLSPTTKKVDYKDKS